MGELARRGRTFRRMESLPDDHGARAVIGTDGAVWTANSAFCALVRLDETRCAASAGASSCTPPTATMWPRTWSRCWPAALQLREFDVRLVPPDGENVPTRIRVELVRDSDGAPGLVPAWRPGPRRRIPAAMDVVDTAEDAAGLELPPLVVREPLEAFLDAHGIGEGESRPSGSARATRTSPSWSRAATRASCCAARRGRRCRPSAHDVLREARLLRALEGTPRCACRACWRSATTRRCSASPSTSWRR